MKISKFATIAFGTMLSVLSVSTASACEDDPRLYSIGSFLNEAQTGNPEPLKLKSTTFLNLTPKTREALGDRIVVYDKECRPMDVFKGELPVRVEAPFQLLYNAFFDSVLRGDQITQQVILSGFIAEPMRSVEILGMMVPATYNQTISVQLATASGVPAHTSAKEGYGCTFGNKVDGSFTAVMLMDLYTRMGGRPLDEDSWVAAFGNTPELFTDVATGTDVAVLRHDNCRIFDVDAMRASAAAAGITPVNALNSDGANKIRQKWIKDGRPSTPQSLFE